MQTRIKELREQKKMSQISLAVRIGCSQNTVSKIEQNECDPKAGILVEMSKLFGVSVDYILGISGEKFTAERSIRLARLIDIGQEYVEKYAKLSEENKSVVNIVVDRLLEMEQKI